MEGSGGDGRGEQRGVERGVCVEVGEQWTCIMQQAQPTHVNWRHTEPSCGPVLTTSVRTRFVTDRPLQLKRLTAVQCCRVGGLNAPWAH